MSDKEIALQLALELVKGMPRLQPTHQNFPEHLQNQAELLADCYLAIHRRISGDDTSGDTRSP